MRFHVSFIPDRPNESERAEKRAERGYPRSTAEKCAALLRGGGEEEEEGGGVEEEEEAVEVSDLFTCGVDLSLLEREAVED